MGKVNGKANRKKGHDYERKWAKIFREEFDYTYCKTSRQASRLLDDSKVDLAFIPFNFQCKNVKAAINYPDEFRLIAETLSKNFPPEDNQHNYPTIIAHKRGSKPEEELIIMKASDFHRLMTGKFKINKQEKSNGDKN